MHVFPSVNELLKMKEDLTKERDEQLQEISRLREELSEANARQSELEQKKAEADEKIQEVSLVFHLGGAEGGRKNASTCICGAEARSVHAADVLGVELRGQSL